MRKGLPSRQSERSGVAAESNPAGATISTMRHPERSGVAAQSNAERAVRRDLGLDVSTPLCLE